MGQEEAPGKSEPDFRTGLERESGDRDEPEFFRKHHEFSHYAMCLMGCVSYGKDRFLGPEAVDLQAFIGDVEETAVREDHLDGNQILA